MSFAVVYNATKNVNTIVALRGSGEEGDRARGSPRRGPTSVYAFMQNIGLVNDHVHGCFRAADYAATARSS